MNASNIGSVKSISREVLREADSAMYVATSSGQDHWVFQRERTGRRLRSACELRGAEERGELRLLFDSMTALPTASTTCAAPAAPG